MQRGILCRDYPTWRAHVTKVLLVEDDQTLGDTLLESLSQEGYTVAWAKTQREALQIYSKQTLDLAIIDVGLPDGDGFMLAREIRSSSELPIIFLTAMTSAEFRLEGYEIGAEDYIPKPFHLKELLLRLDQVVGKYHLKDKVATGAFQLDLESATLSFADGTVVRPALRDLQLLKRLIDSAPQVVSRKEVVEELWQAGSEVTDRTVDNSVVRLRQMLEPVGTDTIRSVRGKGYQWVYEPTNKENS